MRLNINKRIIKAGDVIEVSWDSEEGSDPKLILQTGNRTSALSVPLNGSKRFKMKGQKGTHSVTLVANVYGKEKSIKKRLWVYGKMHETDEFEYVDRGDASPLNQWNNSMKQWWQNYTPEKKRLYIILLLMLVSHLLGSMENMRWASEVIYYGLMFWIFWQVVKK